MRTLSKLGMAGPAGRLHDLVAGGGRAPREVRPPYNVSALDQRAAEFLLEHATAWCAARAAEVVAERTRYPPRCPPVASRVSQRGEPRADPHHRRVRAVAAAGRRSISVRLFDVGRLAGCLRITRGTPAETEALLAAL